MSCIFFKLNFSSFFYFFLIVSQLTQALKFESSHDSPLARFLLTRALRASTVVGHNLFWYLRANIADPHIMERFQLIMEQYLLHIRVEERESFKNECTLTDDLVKIAESVKETPESRRLEVTSFFSLFLFTIHVFNYFFL